MTLCLSWKGRDSHARTDRLRIDVRNHPRDRRQHCRRTERHARGDADSPGLRSWLGRLSTRDILAASFDTRLSGVPVLTARASRSISRLLARCGCRLVLPPESFLVSRQNTLANGEAARACSWGAKLGKTARATYATDQRLPLVRDNHDRAGRVLDDLAAH